MTKKTRPEIVTRETLKKDKAVVDATYSVLQELMHIAADTAKPDDVTAYKAVNALYEKHKTEFQAHVKEYVTRLAGMTDLDMASEVVESLS